MTNDPEKARVNFDQSIGLKDLNYNLPCNSLYRMDGSSIIGCTTRDHNSYYNRYDEGTISRPLCNSVIDWAHDNHGIHCGIMPMPKMDGEVLSICYNAVFITYSRDDKGMNYIDMISESFDSRYEAGSFLVDYIIKTINSSKHGR